MEHGLNVRLNIPKSDISFFGELASKMGWEIQSKESILHRFIETRPKDADLSDEEIMDVIRSIRYSK